MSRPRPASLRRKLIGLAVTCSLIALASTAIALGVYEWYSFRKATLEHFQTVTTLAARNSSAALAFSDPDDALRVLSTLSVEPSIKIAALYEQTGALVSHYRRSGSTTSLPGRAPADGVSIRGSHVDIVVPVAEDKRFGTLLVRADISAIGARIHAYSLVLLGTTLASGLIALLLTRRLLRRITDPVMALAAAASAVQTSKDYRRRVPKQEDDELGTLVDAFNAMLARIGENETELQRHGDRLRLALDAGHIGTCDWDLAADRLHCDARQRELLALPPDQPVTEERFYTALHPDDRPRARDAIQQAVLKTGDFSLEARSPRLDGSLVHLLCRGRAFADPSGAVTRIVAVTTDITERRRAELHVLESERRFRSVAEKAPALIWSCDEHLRRDYFNATWLGFTGRSPEQEHGLGWQEGMPPEDRLRWRSTALAAAARLEPYTIEYRLRRADGALRWMVENASPRFRADGAFAGHLGSCIDITAGKETEAELEARVRLRTRQLEAANNDLGSFSYSVSHDLRAPVRLINGFAEIALEECQAGRAEGAIVPLRSVLRSAGRMNQLIDAFLALARITRAELRIEEVDLSRLAADVVEGLRLGDRPRTVEVIIAPDLRCRGDARLLRILMENLLGNAWKFTSAKPLAHIEVGAETHDDATVFFIRDNGAGFDKSLAGKLFQAFNRLHSNREFEGLGIGLNTVLRVIQRHDGHVWAKGTQTVGATFYFTLPDTSHKVLSS
jgi:PAS domain S-box-containing protein